MLISFNQKFMKLVKYLKVFFIRHFFENFSLIEIFFSSAFNVFNQMFNISKEIFQKFKVNFIKSGYLNLVKLFSHKKQNIPSNPIVCLFKRNNYSK